MDLLERTAAELARLIRRRELSPVELTEQTLRRIDATDSRVRSYITVCHDQALETARRAEREIAGGSYRGPLHGIPLALKDLFDTAGIRTTAGSRILADNVPTRDSEVARRLTAAGAILVGKANMHEFAMGPTSTNPHHGAVRNPWNLECVAGGSSGGSASAVACGQAIISMGSDTGGSIRIPAAFCGIVGFKPTFGRVSRRGVFPLSWSLDHVGPMTRTVEDAALMMQVLDGYDREDPGSVEAAPLDYLAGLTEDSARGVSVGVPHAFFWERLHPDLPPAMERTLRTLNDLGAELRELDLPHAEAAQWAAQVISPAEAAARHHRWLRERPADFGADVRRRLAIGSLISATEYVTALRGRALIRRLWAEARRDVDVVVAPTTPVPAPKVGQTHISVGGAEEDTGYCLPRLTRPFNVTGEPALALPCGFTSDGLPLSLQVVGRAFADDLVLRVGHAYERAAGWHSRRPSL